MIFTYFALTFLVVLCVAVVVSYRKRKAHFEPLRKFPGPPPNFLIGTLFWKLRIYANAKRLNYDPDVYNTEGMMAQAVKYEETGMHCLWYGFLPVVSIYKAEIIERVLRSTISIDKSYFYEFFHEWLGTGLFTSTGAKWKSRRKLLTPCFHFRILENFIPVFNEQSFELVEKLKFHSDEAYIDITPLMFLCTLDIICETIMGISIGAQKGNHTAYIQSSHDLGIIARQRQYYPWVWNDFLFGLTEKGKIYKRLIEVSHSFRDKVIKEKKEKMSSGSNLLQSEDEIEIRKKRKALLDLLMDVNVYGQQLNDDGIAEEVDTFMFAGHDTVATAATYILYCIGLYPEVQEKVHEELNEIFEGNMYRPVTYEDTKKMKYFECVVKESMRLYPPVPLVGRRLSEDIAFGDLKIPRNTTVSLNILALHRNSKVFPNPELFEPGRFLPENSAGRHPYAFIPFSAGPRNCIGQKFAMLELKTIVSNILRHFNVVSLDSRDVFRFKAEMILRPAQEVRLKFLPRF